MTTAEEKVTMSLGFKVKGGCVIEPRHNGHMERACERHERKLWELAVRLQEQLEEAHKECGRAQAEGERIGRLAAERQVAELREALSKIVERVITTNMLDHAKTYDAFATVESTARVALAQAKKESL